jgi:hypothetical protein
VARRCLIVGLVIAVSAVGAGSARGTSSPWRQAATKVGHALLAPGVSLGLPLRDVRVEICSDGHRYVTADYGRGPNGFSIREALRYPCGNTGASWPPLAVWYARQRPMLIQEWCRGCGARTGDYIADWQERGLNLIVTTESLGQHDLLAIVRSLSPVS